MQVEIIAIGDELLLGQVENTNSGWIARKLSGVGISTRWMSVIEDTEEEINDAFRRAFNRADVTLITGGLGPTHDDITKKLLARFFNLPLVFRNDILDDVRALFKKRQLSFIESTREQAEFPEGATPMRNIHGTAPGIWINRSGKIFAAMPGVPLEMRTMMINFVLPRLQEKHIGEVKLFRTFYSLGAREATLFNALDNRKEVEKYAKLAFLPSYSGVRLRLTVSSRVREEALQRLDKAEEILRSRIGKYHFW